MSASWPGCTSTRSGPRLSWSLLSFPGTWHVARAQQFVLKERMTKAIIIGQCGAESGAREIHSRSLPSERVLLSQETPGTRGCTDHQVSAVPMSPWPRSQTSAGSGARTAQLRKTANISQSLRGAKHSPGTWQVPFPLIFTTGPWGRCWAIPIAQMRKLRLRRSLDLAKATQLRRGVAGVELSCCLGNQQPHQHAVLQPGGSCSQYSAI